MEQSGGAGKIGAGLQRQTALGLGIFEFLDARKVPVDQHGVGEWPEMLGRLKFGRMGWQEQQVNMLGHPHLGTGMPARAVEDQHDLFGRTGADLVGEGPKFHREELDGDRRRQMPHGAS